MGEIAKNIDFDYQVIRSSKRKHVCIKVQDCQVYVVVPYAIGENRIQQLVKQKTHWIKGKLEIQESLPPAVFKEYVSGENFTYLGRKYRLKVTNGKPKVVKLSNGRFIVQIPKGSSEEHRKTYIQDKLALWYKEHAQQRLSEITERYAGIIGVHPQTIGIKSFKSRWGSCSITGEILYNWRIIIAPHRIVDSVVVHELCHLVHHNHSDKFWRLVESVFPDYKQCRQWLRHNSRQLCI